MKLEMNEISLAFPGVKALEQAEFEAESGEIHALIGANGAGKSTLMNVLAGVHQANSGTIKIDGELVEIGTPKQALAYGIQLVHQEVDMALFPELTVTENVLSTQLITQKPLFLSWSAMHRRAEQALRELDVDIPVKKRVMDLTLAEKQLVLLARALATECRILILDEPTAPLSNSETAALFRVVKTLKARGLLLVFISHRLQELLDHCDHIIVMRDGKHVLKQAANQLTTGAIVEAMLGKKMEAQFPDVPRTRGAEWLRTEHLSDHKRVKDVSIRLHQGEIVGLAGLVGAGKTELCKLLFGAARSRSGTITIKGKTARLRSPHEAVKKKGWRLFQKNGARRAFLLKKQLLVMSRLLA